MVRVTNEQKTILAGGARLAGLDLSGWLRSLGLREVAAIKPHSHN